MEKRLHRGLEALMGKGKPEITPTTTTQSLQSVPVDSIRANPRQPRRYFDPAKLSELVESIRSQGLLQPIVVRRVDVGYELIAGERRWRACKTLGMERIPAIVRSVEQEQQLVLALVENLQRSDLNAIEEGMAMRRLLEEFGLTHDEVAKRVGKERSTVSNVLRLLELPPEAKEAVSRGTISAGHGRALLSLAGTSDFNRAFQKTVAEGLNVRQTERLAKEFLGAKEAPEDSATEPPDAAAVDLEKRLEGVFGVRATVKLRKRGGVVSFHCAHRKELDYLVETLLSRESEEEVADSEPFPV